MPENIATNELPEELRKKSKKKIKISFLLLLLIINPFINIFGVLGFISQELNYLTVYSFLNYLSFILAGCIFLNEKKIKYSKITVIICGFLIFMLGVNFIVTPLASFKWLINWLGFIFISLVLVEIIKNFTESEFLRLQVKVLNLIRLLLVIFALAMLFTNLANFSFLMDSMAILAGDQVNSIAAHNLGIEKQNLGTLYQIFFLNSIIYWPILKNKERKLLLFIFLTLIPSIIFIRTFLLSMFLLFIFLYLTKSPLKKVLFFIIILLIFIGLAMDSTLINIVEDYYDRLPSLKFAWSAMTENIFGLGNGGYHIYVEKYGAEILALFGSKAMIELNGFWLAPESDLVYFIASWGIMSSFFFLYFVFLLIKGVDLFHNNKLLLPIEKSLILVMFSFVFSGISQDNAGSLIWWTYIAAGSGVLLRHFKQKKQLRQIIQREA